MTVPLSVFPCRSPHSRYSLIIIMLLPSPEPDMEKIPVHSDPAALAAQIRLWGLELGFQQLGISGLDLQDHGRLLQRWLDRGFHGDMAWMATHGEKRWRPELLVEGVQSIISVSLITVGSVLPFMVKVI